MMIEKHYSNMRRYKSQNQKIYKQVHYIIIMAEYTSQCLFHKCKKTFTSNRKRKYCSEICRTRDSARRVYEKVRNDSEFIKRRNEKNKKYYESHKDELIKNMKVYAREYYKKKREKKNEDAKTED